MARKGWHGEEKRHSEAALKAEKSRESKITKANAREFLMDRVQRDPEGALASSFPPSMLTKGGRKAAARFNAGILRDLGAKEYAKKYEKAYGR